MTMQTGAITLDQLAAMVGSTTVRLSVDWLLAPDFAARKTIIERAIDWITQDFAKTRHHRQDRSEDGLTIDVVSALVIMGMDATHDTDIGGHVDIAVRARDDFLWLAEAKIHNAYEWLLKGFDQLTTRYATGLPGQDTGEVIIYCKVKRADLVMEKWIALLVSERPNVTFEPASGTPLVRRSTHLHEGSGRPFAVRHVIIPLHHDPRDRGL